MAKRAVIASRVGGVSEVVQDQQTALLVPSENPDALAQAIKRLLTNVPLRQRLGAAGHERAQDFTWARAVDRYFDVYARLMSHSGLRKETAAALQPA